MGKKSITIQYLHHTPKIKEIKSPFPIKNISLRKEKNMTAMLLRIHYFINECNASIMQKCEGERKIRIERENLKNFINK